MNPWAMLLVAAVAQLPIVPQIEGPESVDAGRLAVYTIEAEQSAQVRWLVLPPESSGLAEQDVAATFEGNRKLAFASPKTGNYRLVAAVSYGDQLDLISLVISVSGSSPPPQPDPTPPPPTPTGWASWAKQTATETVPESFRATEAKRVADGLKIVVEAIRAGRISDPRKARENVRAAVREALQTVEAVNRWKSFSDKLDAKMDAEGEAVNSLADYVRVWTEIAKGLESL
jgi:hypothetical protein